MLHVISTNQVPPVRERCPGCGGESTVSQLCTLVQCPMVEKSHSLHVHCMLTHSIGFQCDNMKCIF